MQEASAWHAALEQFLARRRDHHRLSAQQACKQTVWFFCRLRGQTPGTADQSWGPSSVVRGLGGSEEAAVYLSRELARLGHCVRVYGNPPSEEWGLDEHGVEWLPFWDLGTSDKVDNVVLWRNFDSVWLAPNATRSPTRTRTFSISSTTPVPASAPRPAHACAAGS